MGKQQEEPTPLNQNQDSKLCLSCGFPSRSSDARCMYCNTSLAENGGLFSWLRDTFYIIRWRWELKQKDDSVKSTIQKLFRLKTVSFFFLGIILSGAGILFFIEAVVRNSFSNALISIVLILYGFFTLKFLLKNRY